jgi:hypothetical protein
MFIIEDEFHAEIQDGRFETRLEAIEEMKRRAAIPWNEPPNCAPCMSWRTCGRRYEIVEFDDSRLPWKQLSRTPMLEVSADGVRWLHEEQGYARLL